MVICDVLEWGVMWWGVTGWSVMWYLVVCNSFFQTLFEHKCLINQIELFEPSGYVAD